MAERLHVVRGELLPGVTYIAAVVRETLARCQVCGRRHWRATVGDAPRSEVVLCRACLLASREQEIDEDGLIGRVQRRPDARCMRWER